MAKNSSNGRGCGLSKTNAVAAAVVETLEQRRLLSVATPAGYVPFDTIAMDFNADQTGASSSPKLFASGESYKVIVDGTFTVADGSISGRPAAVGDAVAAEYLGTRYDVDSHVDYGVKAADGITLTADSALTSVSARQFAFDFTPGTIRTPKFFYNDDQPSDNSGLLTLHVFKKLTDTSEASPSGANKHDGTYGMTAIDISSAGFSGWTQRRAMTNSILGQAGSSNGDGVVLIDNGYIVKGESGSIGVSDGDLAVRFFADAGGGAFTGNHGKTDTLSYNSTTDVYEHRDIDGSRALYYGFNSAVTTNSALQGQLKERSDTSGNQTVINRDSAGRITTVVSTSGSNVEKFTYSYLSSGENSGLLSSILLERSANTGTSWASVKSVEYAYYTSSDGMDLSRHLKTVERYEDLSGPASSIEYFRHGSRSLLGTSNLTYSGGVGTAAIAGHTFEIGDKIRIADAAQAAFNGTFTITTVSTGLISFAMPTNPGVSTATGAAKFIAATDIGGYLKYYFNDASYARLKAVYSTPSSATNAQAKPYASNLFEYDDAGRVGKEIVQGTGCSACSGGFGTTTTTYVKSTNTAGYNAWDVRTTDTLADGNQNITYTNAYGQVMMSIFKDTGSGQQWRTYYKYDSSGRLVLQASPTAVTTHSDTYADLVNTSGGNASAVSDTSGLVTTWDYYVSSDEAGISETAAAGAAGYLKSVSVREGETVTAVPQALYTYVKRVDAAGKATYLVATETRYRNDNGTGGQTTSYAYAWHGTTAGVKSVTATLPVVSSSTQNGSGSAVTATTLLDTYGRPVWSIDGAGYVSYVKYDTATGGILQQIIDASPGSVSSPSVTAPTRTATATALHLVTDYVLDTKGRVTKVTDPNGDVTYNVYKDAYTVGSTTITNEVRTYRGVYLDGSTWKATGPTAVTRTVKGATLSYDVNNDGTVGTGETGLGVSFVEALTSSATPSFTSGVPNGSETIDSGNIKSLSRSIVNGSGQIIAVDQYTTIGSGTYSQTTTRFGGTGTALLTTAYAYDSRGRVNMAKVPDGTVYRTVYDGLGRAASSWKGTNDSGWTQANPAAGGGSNNMVKVAENIYDGGAVGDSRLTESRQLADVSVIYSTNYLFDYRGRMTAVRGPDGVGAKYVHDNLGQTTETKTFADLDSDFQIDTGELRGKSVASYDDWGQVYEQSTYEVNPLTGVDTDRLTSRMWYDARGMAVKSLSPNGLINKAVFDGAGRAVASYLTTDTTDTENASGTATSAYVGAQNISGDHVIEQYKTWYDAGGRSILSVSYARTADSSSTGALGSEDSFSQSVATWYDHADRPVASANYGWEKRGVIALDGTTTSVSRVVFSTGGALIDSNTNGVPDVSEGSVPSTPSDETQYSYILNQVAYDGGGRAYRSIDNKGRIKQTNYDLAGRTVATIENYEDGTSDSTDSDRVTAYAYDSHGRLSTMTAEDRANPTFGNNAQVTTYHYEDPTDGSLVTKTELPTGYPYGNYGDDRSLTTYDRLGRQTQTTDSRDVIHQFRYDSAGRLAADTVTSLGGTVIPASYDTTTVDGSVRSIGYSYDDLGRVINTTSYGSYNSTTKLGSGTPVNQTRYTYDGWGNIAKEYQSHSGAVNDATESGTDSPVVTYVYADGASSGEAKYVRLSSVTYPNGREIDYAYNSSGTDDDALSRLYTISDGTTALPLSEYHYAGSGTLTREVITGVTGTTTAGTGHGGLALDFEKGGTMQGFDRFGRIATEQWASADGTFDLDSKSYVYDRTSNVRREKLAVSGTTADDAQAEVYTYDGLDRLKSLLRGVLNTGGDDPLLNVYYWDTTFYDVWALSLQGNWYLHYSDQDGASATVSERAYYEQNFQANKIYQIFGDALDPTYDQAGNMVKTPRGLDLDDAFYTRYDAWGRATGIDLNNDGDVSDAGEVTYAYDGQGRRISKDFASGSTQPDEDTYYNTSYQAVEVKHGSATYEQNVFDPKYIDAPLVRYRDADANSSTGTLGTEETLFFTYDKQFNVSAVWDPNQTAVERYAYSGYGERTVLNADLTKKTINASTVDQRRGHQGLEQDAETGAYYNRARLLLPQLGVFNRMDPSGYTDSYNLYQPYGGNPTAYQDPSGLFRPINYDDPASIKAEQDALRADIAAEQANRDDLDDRINGMTDIQNAVGGFGDGFVPFYSLLRRRLGEGYQVDENSVAYHGGEALGLVAGFATGAGEIKGGTAVVEVGVVRIVQVVGGGTRIVTETREVVVTAGAVLQVAVATNAVVLQQTSDGMSGGGSQGGGSGSSSSPTKTNAQLRREWEKANGKPWPKDAANGRNQDVSHIKPKADGGSNTLDNIEPKLHDEHVKQHMENGDFKRWGTWGKGRK